jgi:thiamine kinase-like enzyme
VPGWAATPPHAIAATTVSGGITNSLTRLARAPAHGGGSVLVRVFGAGTEVLIDRARDNALFQRMAARGYGPPHYCTFGNGRVEGWVEHSRPLEPAEMGAAGPPLDVAGALARALAAQHALVDVEATPPPWAPLLWDRLRAWDELVARDAVGLSGARYLSEVDWLEELLPSRRNGGGSQLLAAMAAEEEAEAARGARGGAGAAALLAARRAAAALCFRVVFCHNDVLAGNVLLVAPPGQPPRVQLIDFEYMGPNFLGYDIANCFCEHCGFLPFEPEVSYPSAQQQLHFLEAYLEASSGGGGGGAAAAPLLPPAGQCREAFLDELRRWVSLFCLASHLWCELGGVAARGALVCPLRISGTLTSHTHYTLLFPSSSPLLQGACGLSFRQRPALWTFPTESTQRHDCWPMHGQRQPTLAGASPCDSFAWVSG